MQKHEGNKISPPNKLNEIQYQPIPAPQILIFNPSTNYMNQSPHNNNNNNNKANFFNTKNEKLNRNKENPQFPLPYKLKGSGKGERLK